MLQKMQYLSKSWLQTVKLVQNLLAVSFFALTHMAVQNLRYRFCRRDGSYFNGVVFCSLNHRSTLRFGSTESEMTTCNRDCSDSDAQKLTFALSTSLSL